MELELSSLIEPPIVPTVDNDDRPLEAQKKLYNERFQKDTEWRCRLSWWVIGQGSRIKIVLSFASSRATLRYNGNHPLLFFRP